MAGTDPTARDRRLAGASRLLPPAAVARLAVRRIGPAGSARLAAELPPRRAGALADRLPPAFLAELCAHLDTDAAARVVPRLADRTLLAVAAELAARGDHAVLAALVDAVPVPRLAAVQAALDDAAMLLTGVHLTSAAQVGRLLDAVPAERLDRLIGAAATGPPELLRAGLTVMARADADRKARLGDLAGARPEAELGRLLTGALAQGVIPELLDVVLHMGLPAQRRVLALPELADRAVLAAMLDTATGEGLWERLLPLIRRMPPPTRAILAAVVVELPDAALAAALGTARRTRQWPAVAALVPHLGTAGVARIARIAGRSAARGAARGAVRAAARGTAP
jgi:hypothetical protein